MAASRDIGSRNNERSLAFAPVPGLARPALWSVGGFTFDLTGTTAVDRPVAGASNFWLSQWNGNIFGPAALIQLP